LTDAASTQNGMDPSSPFGPSCESHYSIERTPSDRLVATGGNRTRADFYYVLKRHLCYFGLLTDTRTFHKCNARFVLVIMA